MRKTLKVQEIKATSRFQLCHHVSAGRINAPKRCMLNYECFHCSYDQWLDAIDLEKMQRGLNSGTLRHGLAQAA